MTVESKAQDIDDTANVRQSESTTLLSEGIDICPDYDDDCKDVHDPTDCFLGWMPCLKPMGINLGVADGLCPEMRNR